MKRTAKIVSALLVLILVGAFITHAVSAREEGSERGFIDWLIGVIEYYIGERDLVGWVDSIGTPAGSGIPGALRDVDGSFATVVVARGYWHPGDGGGGLFFWRDPADASFEPADEDLGTVIVPTSEPPGAGYWQRNYSGPVNLRWFGKVAPFVKTENCII